MSERGSLVLVVLRLPHLVLAYVGDDDGRGPGGYSAHARCRDDVRGVEVAVVGQVDDVAHGGVPLLC
jgi:hypothetical protein